MDVSELSLCSLPSLLGMPRELELEGREAGEAQRWLEQLAFDHPGFEVKAGAITLGEIHARAEAVAGTVTKGRRGR